jgi:hypothetical protein
MTRSEEARDTRSSCCIFKMGESGVGTFQAARLARSLFFCYWDMFANFLELRINYARAKVAPRLLLKSPPDGRLFPANIFIALSDSYYKHTMSTLYGI